MTRGKLWIALGALLLIAATALPSLVAPHDAGASPLGSRLRHARHELQRATDRLAIAQASLDAALDASVTSPAGSATPEPTAGPANDAAGAAPTLAQLEARVTRAQGLVKRWSATVRRLEGQLRLQRRLAQWNRRGQWRKIIDVAAAKYRVKADGIYRMMMRESGGQRYAGSGGAYKGLFQYYTGTWSASWNPYRHHSIYDGLSQIFATCYAVHRGFGPSMWTTTYASQY